MKIINKSFKYEIKITFLLLKIYFIIMTLFFKDKIISSIKFNLFYIRAQQEVNNIKSYFNFCKEKTNIIKNFEKPKNIKISIISPVYNRQKYLRRFLKSLQFQYLKDIEIILVDDKSTDNGIGIIEEYKKKDKRIKLIKNKKNRGIFITRNIGLLSSKGKYIIFPDPDDILSQDILKICYNYAEKYNYDIVKFKNYERAPIDIDIKGYYYSFENKPIYQPELSTLVFYDNNELRMRDIVITNKIIKREKFILGLNSLNDFYSNLHMSIAEDTLMNYIIYQKANSFYYLKKIGYYYYKNTESMGSNYFKLTHLKLETSFIFLKCIFEYSKNTKYEKDMANYLLRINHESELFSTDFSESFYFYYDTVNKLLNCSFIESDNINVLKKYKKIIEMKNQTYINQKKKKLNNTSNSFYKKRIL